MPQNASKGRSKAGGKATDSSDPNRKRKAGQAKQKRESDVEPVGAKGLPSFGATFGAANVADFQYIRSLYDLYGHRITKELDGASNTPYLLVEIAIPGLGVAKAVVALLPKELVGGADVKRWIATANEIANARECNKTIVVYASEKSPTSSSASSVIIVSIGDLESQVLELRSALVRFVASYESLDIHVTYISLGATIGFDDVIGEKIASADEAIREWISIRKFSILSVLGDYGAGKTTLMNRLRYYYAKSFVELGRGLKPVLIQLREYDRWKSLEGLLRHSLLINFDREVPLSIFWRGLQNGDFLILLDGFDEMASQSDASTRRTLLHHLSALFHSNSPVVITCRPAYFVSADEYNSHVADVFTVSSPPLGKNERARAATAMINSLEAQLAAKYVFADPKAASALRSSSSLRLSGVSVPQIRKYFNNRDGEFRHRASCSADEVFDFLMSVYDLSDLMQRPIILAMIADTVLEGHINVRDKNTKIGPTELYRIYTNMELSRDWHKGATRQLLTKDQRTVFAVTLALAMFKKKTLEIDHGHMIATIKESRRAGQLIRAIREASIDAIATDIRTCGFLTIAGGNMYRFAHRSFMEYFVATQLHDDLKSRKLSDLLKQDVAHDILYFLGGYAFTDTQISSIFKQILSKSDMPAGPTRSLDRNIAVASLYSGGYLSNIEFQDIEIYSSRHQRLTLDKLYMAFCRVSDVYFSHVLIQDSRLVAVEFSKCDWIDVTFKSTHFELTLNQVTATRLAIGPGDGSISAARSTDICEPRFVAVVPLLLEGAIRIDGGVVQQSQVLFRKSPIPPLLQHLELIECRLEAETVDAAADIVTCSFSDTMVLGLNMSREGFETISRKKGIRGYVLCLNVAVGSKEFKDGYCLSQSIVGIDCDRVLVAIDTRVKHAKGLLRKLSDEQRAQSDALAARARAFIESVTGFIRDHVDALASAHFAQLVSAAIDSGSRP